MSLYNDSINQNKPTKNQSQIGLARGCYFVVCNGIL